MSTLAPPAVRIADGFERIAARFVEHGPAPCFGLAPSAPIRSLLGERGLGREGAGPHASFYRCTAGIGLVTSLLRGDGQE